MKPQKLSVSRFQVFQSMALSTQMNTKPNQRPRCSTRRLIRSIGITMVVLLILLGLSLVINWLILMPKKVIFLVEKGHISNHTMTDTRIKGTFELQIKAFNPNRMGSVYYDRMKVIATYLDQKVAVPIKPFYQPPRNETNLDVKFDGEFVSPFGNMKRDVTREGIKFSVRIRAKIRFKLRRWMAKGREVDIFCPSVVEYVDSTRSFESVPCQIDL